MMNPSNVPPLDLTLLGKNEDFIADFSSLDFTTHLRSWVQGEPKNWLKSNGYREIKNIAKGAKTFLVAKDLNFKKWAVYQPYFIDRLANAEIFSCLTHNIRSEREAQSLLQSFMQFPDRYFYPIDTSNHFPQPYS